MTVRAARSPDRKLASARSLIALGAGAAILVVVIAALLLWPDQRRPALALNEPGLIDKVESLYNDIYVYRVQSGNLVLAFGAQRLRYTESEVNPKDELDLPVYYTQAMTSGLAYASTLDDALIVGLGGGRTAWYHHKSIPELNMTAVELDPEVVRLATEYFGVSPEPKFDIAVMDGRIWLDKTDRTFDIVMVDAYRGPFVPFHLLTAEFYKLIAERLKPGGVVVQNVEPTTMLFDSAVATIKSAFEHVVFLEGEGNIVILAYNGPLKDEATLQKIAAERQAKYGFRYDLTRILVRRYEPKWDDKTKPLTDDFAPVEYLKAVERHNEKRQ